MAPFLVLAVIVAAAFGSTWLHDRRDRDRTDRAAAKAARLDRYCHLMQTTVTNARELAVDRAGGITADRAGVALWNDLVMYDARALVPCLRDETVPLQDGEHGFGACADGDAACVRSHAAAALMWFAPIDTP